LSVRKIQLANEEYYHVFNRGVDRRNVFSDEKDYDRFFLSMQLLNNEKDGLMIQWRNFKFSQKNASVDEFVKSNLHERKKLVDIISFCLNPNHYHFVLKQIQDRGIERFMHKISTSHTKYFNERNHRNGSLFQGSFKATHIDSNELLLHLVAYVNCNAEIHGIAKAENYEWCSYPDYLGKRESNILSTNVISDQFNNIQSFRELSGSYVKHFRERKADENLFLE
jgi:putative transposase